MDAETRTMVRSGLDASAYTAGAAQVVQANDRIAESGEQVVRTTAAAEGAARRKASAIERLQGSLDQTYRSQQQFERAQATINAAMERGTISTQRAAELQSLAQQRYLGAGAAASALAAANDNAGRSAGRLGQFVGQAGFQVQDFAGQVMAGQNALVALGQQGSQLLSVFGVGGAIAGAALTVGILAAQLMGVGKAGEDAGRQAADAAKEVQAAQDALATALRTVNDLFLTQEQRARAAANAQIEQTRASLTRQRDLANVAIVGRGRDRDTALADAERLERQLRAERERNERIRRGGGMVATDAEAELERRAQAARLAAQQAILAQGEARGDVADAERGLARLDLAATLAGLRADVEGRDPVPGGEPRGAAPRPDRSTLAADRDRFMRDTETALDRYERRIGEISVLAAAAREAGNPIPEENIRRATDAALADLERVEQGTKRIGDETQRAGQAANQLGFSFSSAFEDAILGGERFSAVLQGLEQDIARIIIRSAVTQPLGNAISNGITDFLRPAQSEITGLAGPPKGRAMGGPVMPGRTYLVGEEGPELLTMGGAGGHVTPNHALGGVTFAPVYNIDARGADASMLPRLRAEMVSVARAANAELLAEINRGGAAARIVGRR